MTKENHSQDIIFTELRGKHGNIGHILLNRPKALNALTAEMCQQLRDQLLRWQRDDAIKAVIIRGDGDRAFCAGGDIRRLYQDGKENLSVAEHFFRQEYQMNAAIFHFDKPYISLLDGITMGGGAGVSVHGSHRVATERLLFAMPETGIGFFPDVGGGYFLSRCADKMGYYLGLTGARIDAADAYALGLATHIIASDQQEILIDMLLSQPFSAKDTHVVSDMIADFSLNLEPSHLFDHKATIIDCFSRSSIEEMMLRLEEIHSDWSSHTKKTLLAKSPTSLKVTLEQLTRAQTMEFNDIMEMEFNMTLQFLHASDFFEGVRAVVIDKDQQPQWKPNKLQDVSEDKVNSFFVRNKKLFS